MDTARSAPSSSHRNERGRQSKIVVANNDDKEHVTESGRCIRHAYTMGVVGTSSGCILKELNEPISTTRQRRKCRLRRRGYDISILTADCEREWTRPCSRSNTPRLSFRYAHGCGVVVQKDGVVVHQSMGEAHVFSCFVICARVWC